MNILIDINHPAHVHLMRNSYKMLVEKGNKVLVVVKEIPSAMKLLDLYGIPYVNIGKKDDANSLSAIALFIWLKPGL